MNEITTQEWTAIHELKRRLPTMPLQERVRVDASALTIFRKDFTDLTTIHHEKDWRDLTFIGCDFTEVNLYGFDLRGVRFTKCNFRGAYMSRAELRGANFYQCDLTDAQLEGARTEGMKYDYRTVGLAMACPEEGAFIAFKKICVYNNDWMPMPAIAKLYIPADALRSSATTRKCRASRAVVMEITSLSGKIEYTSGFSAYYQGFRYRVGESVEPQEKFEEERWQECASGIHFFMTRDEAVQYHI